MYNKLLKETIRQNNGNRNVAQAEVISACRRIPDKNTVFAVLTRNNKLFNKDGIKFSAKDGQIVLNGVSVDLIEFGNIPKVQKAQFLAHAPAVPEPAQTLNNTSTWNLPEVDISIIISAAKYGLLIMDKCLLSTSLRELVKDFSDVIQKKIFKILQAVLDILLRDFLGLDAFLKKYVHLNEPIELILKVILHYLEKLADYLERQHLEENQTQLSDYNEGQFNNSNGINSSFMKYKFWCSKAINLICTGGINEQLLQELINYIFNILTEKLVEYCITYEENSLARVQTGERKPCTICNGYYYSAS